MKIIKYVVLLPTNIPEDVDEEFIRRLEQEICDKIKDYQLPKTQLSTSVNGNVLINFYTHKIELNTWGDIQFFFHLICNDDVEKNGIQDEIYKWVEKELRNYIDYIIKLKIQVGQGLHPNPDGDTLNIITSDLDTDFIDGCIESIDNYKT